MLKWLVNIIFKYKGRITAILTIQLCIAVLVSIQPYYFQRIVSLVINRTQTDLFSEGLPVIAMLGIIYLVWTVLQGLNGYISCIFSSGLLRQLQEDFFDKISQLPIQSFQHQPTGEFFTRFNNDIGQTQGFICSFVPSALRELMIAIVVTAILFYSCPAKLALAALLIVVVTSLLVGRLNHIMARYAKAQRAGWSEINRVFDETVEGIDTLKTFASENQRRELFQRHTASFRNISVRAGSIAAIFSPGIDLISKLGGLLLILIAYFLISHGNMTTESFLMFFFYAGLLQMSISSLAVSLLNIQSQLVGVRNISTFFSESPEDSESDNLSTCLDRSVPIEINGLTFSYPGGRTLYSSASLFIPANSITVIHGPSGSGKSTLINLLLRFYTPQAGIIRFGGDDIEKFSRRELRWKIGVVTQYHYIFHDTLRVNLLIARPDAATGEIMNAIKRSHLTEFLQRLPDGIETVMDPRGKGISEGEKQRISIARLLLKESPIMVLDEPWSNLDEEARETLAEVLNRCKLTTTVLILTHEDLPYLNVDRIYRLSPDKRVFVREKYSERQVVQL